MTLPVSPERHPDYHAAIGLTVEVAEAQLGVKLRLVEKDGKPQNCAAPAPGEAPKLNVRVKKGVVIDVGGMF